MAPDRLDTLDETQAEPILTRETDGSVATLRLNRPQAGNSLSRDLIAALKRALDQVAAEHDVKVVVLEGIGERIFCAGHDLKEFTEQTDPAAYRDISLECSAMMQTITALPQPVIAKVRGVATAAGLQLVAAADLAVAAADARFATPGVNIGLWCHTPQVALSRSVHRKHAFEMLVTGRLFDADHALRIGLVNRVVPPEELDAVVAELAATIASKSSYTVSLGKQSFYRQGGLSLSDAYAYVSDLVEVNMLHPDAKEGIDAFVEKRTPRWRGR
jgi:enoyl-CoA hydratase/carnithine racemase